MTLSYHTRNDALSPEKTFVLSESALEDWVADGQPQIYPLAEIVKVRLAYEPSRPEPNRYSCTVWMQNGQNLKFYNRRYAGIYDFRDTSSAYVAFVDALHLALARHAPACQYVSGSGNASYIANLACIAFIVLVLLGVAVFALLNGLAWLVIVKLVFIVFYLPTLVRWVKNNRPANYSPRELPPCCLPKVTPSSGPPPLPPV